MTEPAESTLLTVRQRLPRTWVVMIVGGFAAALITCAASIVIRGFDANDAQALLYLAAMAGFLARFHTRTIRVTAHHVLVGHMTTVVSVPREQVIGVMPKVILTSTTRRPSRHGCALRGFFDERD